jgi:hypothetical protein
MSDNDPTKTWITIVPEFYYDLISRIPPGMFLILGVIFEILETHNKTISDYKDFNTAFVILFTILLLTAAYSVGLFINIPTKYLAMIYTAKAWRRVINDEKSLFKELKEQDIFKDFNFISPSTIKEHEARRLFRRVHDLLKLKDNQAKVILPKLTAESSLCSNTAFALIIYLIIHGINCGWDKVLTQWLAYLICLSLSFLLALLAGSKYYRAIETHIVFLTRYSKTIGKAT